jgi:hypothetical protein
MTTTSRGGIILSTTWGAAMSNCTVLLKMLNLVLMGSTPQHILLFLVVFGFTFIFMHFFFPVLL